VINRVTWLIALLSAAMYAADAIEPPVSGGAQPTLPAFVGLDGTLSLEDALSMAERYNPELRAALAGVEGAQAGVTTARAWLNPTVTFGSLGRQQALLRTAAIPGMLHGLNFNQPVELPMVRSTRIRAAQVRRESSEWALAETRLAIRGLVKQAFFEALRQEGAVTVAQENLGLLEDLKRRIEVQVNVGEAARLELTRAEAELASARIQVRSAELRHAAALSTLSAAIGAPVGNLELEGTLDPAAVLPALETLRSDMLARHPSMGVVESEIRRADANIANEKAQRIPQPSFWMDYFQQPEAAQYRFGVTIPIPVLNRREGPIAEALAERRRMAALADHRRVQLTAALEQAYNLYQVANQQVAIFETGTLLQAEAAVRAAQAAFKFGERGIIEVLDAQRVLRAAQLEYLNAKYDRQQALTQLEQLRVLDTGESRP
jgi:cobalt-zinc-cadmium efflux system outer membrane protein